MADVTSSSHRSKLDFPAPGSRNAPKTFGGHYDEVDFFLKEFERLAQAYNLNIDDRFDYIIRHVKHDVREVIEGLTEYTNKDWTKLQATLRDMYDHVRTEKRFKEKDLVEYVNKTRNHRIHTLFDFTKY